ncbi:MAG TPA: hypothetical protein VIJ79_10675 [Acidobacteriaceae bacterium]
MTTVSIDEVSEALPRLLREVDQGPVAIRDGECDVAILVDPNSWSERAERVARLEQSRERVVSELTEKLATANIRYVDFVEEILNEF